MRCLTASSDYSRSPTCRSQSRDDTDVAGQSTRWGSVVNRGLCRHDAEIVRRLRRAGAIVIGKTNVPELTLWPWTASEAFGTTRNPWDATRTPGGSSGSSAVAVSTGMAAIGLGSDGGGSIRYPAGLTGLVRAETTKRSCACGRRTRIRVARPRRPWPLTRSVRDAACFLDIASAARASTTFRDALEEPSSRLRIAVSTNPIRSPVWAGRSPTGHSDGRSGDRRRSLTRSTGYSTAQTLCSHRCAKRQHRSSTTAPPAEDAIASSSEHLSLARTLERDRTARTRRPDGPQQQHANLGSPRRPTQ